MSADAPTPADFAAPGGWTALRDDVERRLSAARRRKAEEKHGHMTDSQDYHRGEIVALAWIARRIARTKEVPPIDPKLSDGGAWRGSCEGGAQKEAADVGQRHDRTGRVQARIAATVTRGAVRCSAWLGDFIGLGQTPEKSSGSNARTRDGCPNVNVWKAGIGLAHAMEKSEKPPLCRGARTAAREACGRDRLAIGSE